MKEQLISKDEITNAIPALNTRVGKYLLDKVMRLFGLYKANALYDRSKQYEGVEFCKHLLNDIEVNIFVENREILEQFKNQAFITVSNHPYGHIDGISAIATVGELRSDYKITANFILGLVDTMATHFIVINPYKDTGEVSSSSIDCVKKSINHIKAGHPMGFFPAGAVSEPTRKGFGFTIEDRTWRESTVKLIKKLNVPVIPMYFTGQNSWIFNYMMLKNQKLQTIRLVAEMLNKRGKTIYLRFGQPIMPEKMNTFPTIKELAAFLKSSTYALAKAGDK